MAGYSSADSNISLDSLEAEFKKKSYVKKLSSDDNVDTILVPFYEKDVLIKVPKGKKLRDTHDGKKGVITKKECPPIKNYLMNKEVQKPKRTTYLEIFRNQFPPTQTSSKKIKSEIRSISPEFGDTERESFVEDLNNPVADFFNTEAYNEIYYEKLLNQELNTYLEQSYEEQLKFSDDIRSKSPDEIDLNNLKSVSDVSQPRRNVRRATVQPIQNIKLGGLGPDMENIKPRLERARSLQRYSEKVRMENRVRIYKKSVQDDIDKKEKELTIRRQESARTKERKDCDKSYLINKNVQDKQSQNIRKIYNSKSKSASVERTRERLEIRDKISVSNNNQNQNKEKNKHSTKAIYSKVENSNKEKESSYDKNKSYNDSDIKQVNVPVPPVQISFLVNMGGIRPSSALRKLEAKHRMYQEKVREFTVNNINSNSDKESK